MSIRNEVCNFMMNNNHPSIQNFKQRYNQQELPISRITWNDYWFGMNQNKVWVDYKFIQGTAWYLNHDIMIVTTGSTPENPYLYISGNLTDENFPCPGVPLLIGSQLDLHYQSLLPTEHVSEARPADLKVNEDNFPSLKKPSTNIGKNENSTKKESMNETTRQAKVTSKNIDMPKRQNRDKKEDNFCPNCQRRFEDIQKHFQLSFICKQTSNQGLTPKVEDIPPKIKRHHESNSRKIVCKGCMKEITNLERHVSKSFPCQNQYKVDEKLNENCDLDIEQQKKEPEIKKQKRDKK